MRTRVVIDLLAMCGYSLSGLPNPVKNKMVRFFAGNPQAIKPASVAEVGLSFLLRTRRNRLKGLIYSACAFSSREDAPAERLPFRADFPEKVRLHWMMSRVLNKLSGSVKLCISSLDCLLSSYVNTLYLSGCAIT